ncbi:MAG: flagellar hook-basal body protein [Melioribacteraceae bacterium]|nr:flagellar hook-basal body protein [Melioribacteraceae bacterium]
MADGLENAALAMINKLQNIQIVANNLANVNTTGFKRGLEFYEVLENEQNNISREVTDFSEGVFVETNNPLNAAISGDAYFSVQTPEGEQITKNGDFLIDKNGYLTTREGFKVLAQNGDINLQEELLENKGELVINKNGEIKAGDKVLSKLKIVMPEDVLKLKKADGQRFYTDENVYQLADESDFKIYHGYLESSNTNAILEMQAMIQLQKDYEASQRMITTIDSIMGLVKEMGKI